MFKVIHFVLNTKKIKGQTKKNLKMSTKQLKQIKHNHKVENEKKKKQLTDIK